MSDSWRITLPCTRDEALQVGDIEVEGAVLVATEEDEGVGRWRLEVYCEGEPDANLRAAVAALVAGEPRIERLDDADWVTLSQAGLEPVRAGRFVVHTPAFPTEAPPGGRAFVIEAACAFGTGHHETTAGCLEMLDGLAGEHQFYKIIDLGTGTGLLAFAACELWPMADVTATDIDPIAIEVAIRNALSNNIELGDDIGEVTLLLAEGTNNPKIRQWASYDLIIANILAQPLIELAPDIAAIAAKSSRLMLAGLLTTQADAVIAAYDAHGFAVADRFERGDWTILLLCRD